MTPQLHPTTTSPALPGPIPPLSADVKANWERNCSQWPVVMYLALAGGRSVQLTECG